MRAPATRPVRTPGTEVTPSVGSSGGSKVICISRRHTGERVLCYHRPERARTGNHERDFPIVGPSRARPRQAPDPDAGGADRLVAVRSGQPRAPDALHQPRTELARVQPAGPQSGARLGAPPA